MMFVIHGHLAIPSELPLDRHRPGCPLEQRWLASSWFVRAEPAKRSAGAPLKRLAPLTELARRSRDGTIATSSQALTQLQNLHLLSPTMLLVATVARAPCE